MGGGRRWEEEVNGVYGGEKLCDIPILMSYFLGHADCGFNVRI